jgi:hypothetical protein
MMSSLRKVRLTPFRRDNCRNTVTPAITASVVIRGRRPPGRGVEDRPAVRKFLLVRHRWLTGLLAGWPPAERCESARLIGRFTGDIDRSLDELNL